MNKFLNSTFKLRALGTNIKTEIIAGISTALGMFYIVAVNPSILSASGAPFEPIFVATVVSAALACFFMGFYANLPIGLASGMGLNAFTAFFVCKTLGYTYEEALAAIFVAGILFLLISLTKIRMILLQAIPYSLKLAIAGAIGMFIAFIGFQISGLSVGSKATLVTLGNIKDPTIILMLLGVAAIIILDKYRVKGSMILVIVTLSVIGWVSGLAEAPKEIITLPPAMSLWFAMDFGKILTGGMISVIMVYLFVDFTDSSGTIISCMEKLGKINKKGQLKGEGVGKALLSDSVGTVAGAAMGTTVVTSYIESGIGIRAGGKSGLTAVVVGIGFLLCLFFSTVFTAIPTWADAPVLIAVGFMFMEGLKKLNWTDITETSPALIAIFAVPFTYSIAIGIQIAILMHIVVNVLTGNHKKISLPLWIIGIICALIFVIQ
jgi:AGZA family xanthine/uracil permease-like MFS transporter